MTAGLLQLVTKGADDMFLTHDPKITLFKIVYRRCTNFTKIEHRLNFPNVLTFDKQGTINIKRLADLVNRMYLVVDLPDIILNYQSLTFKKLNEILGSVGIVYNFGRELEEIVTLSVYQEIILPLIRTTIINYRDLIVLANQELITIKSLRENFCSDNLLRFMNPCGILTESVLSIPKYPILPIKYKIYLNYIKTKARFIPSFVPIYNVYSTLFELYNLIDGDKIQILNASTVKNIICDTAQSLVYLRNLTITLVPGYQLPYIIGSGDNLRLIQSTFIGDNYIIFDSLKRIISNIPIQVTYPLSGYFSNYITNSGIGIDLQIIGNLDLDIYYKKYIAEIDKIDYLVCNNLVSHDKIIAVKNTLLAILSEALPNNIKQFIRILEIARFFRVEFRTNNLKINKVGLETMLKYGFFSPMPNIQNMIIQHNVDRNIFFYDNDYSYIRPGDYYNNWIKHTVNGFFGDLQEVIQNPKFGPYYTDCSYWSFLNLTDELCIEQNLSGILKGPFGLTNGHLINRVWFTEFIPIVVAQNLYSIFHYCSSSKGRFWDNLFESKKEINMENRHRYLHIIMNQYRCENDETYKLDELILNYIICRTEQIKAPGHILANIFAPNISYNSDILPLDPNLSFFQGLYGNLSIPHEMTPLDYLLIVMGLDIMSLIDNSNIPPLCLIEAKLTVIRILHLYIMTYEEIPPYIISNIDPIRYNPLPTFPPQFICRNIMDTTFCNYNNNVARISSIYNFISCSQRNLYNSLFQNKLLSTNYYRLYTSRNNLGRPIITPSLCGREVGIGFTMQQTYELFVSHFYNQRLNVCAPQMEPLELMIEQTNFYNISCCDPIYPNDFLGRAILSIHDNIYLNIYVVMDNIIKHGNILEVRNVDLDPILYFGSLYQIMSAGISKIEFNLSENDLVSVHPITSIPTVPCGYTSKIFQNLELDPINRDIFVGECYKSLGICPLTSVKDPVGINRIFGFNYTSMVGFFPSKLDPTCIKIYRGVVDFFGQIKSILRQKFCDTITIPIPELIVYDETLRVCNIHVQDPLVENFLNEIIITNNCDNLDSSQSRPDPIYRHFFSETNTQGTLFTDINPIGFNSADISTFYKGFENPYSILQFLLDMMIFNIRDPNFPILIINNEKTTLDNYEIYLLKEIEKYNCYLELLTNTIGSLDFEGSEVCLRINNLLNPFYPILPEKRAEFAWAKYIGYDLIDEISIRIGGQLIDKHNYKWMYLDYKMNKHGNQKKGHSMMIGNIPELYTYNAIPKCSHRMYIPIQFWFCKNISQSLPMISLQHTDVSISVKIKPLHEVAYWNDIDTYFAKEPILDCHLLTDYIYLDSEERNRFAEAKHEYLIETVQRSLCAGGERLLSESGRTINCGVDFSNICKYIIWNVRFNKTFRINQKRSELYSMRRILNWMDFYNMGDNDAIRGFEIKFDQRDRETMKHQSYYNLVQPYEKYCSSLPKNVFLYSFALYPKLLQPSGGINIDMIDELSITMEISEEISRLIKDGLIEVEVDIYGREINILRIMNGIGGLVFYGGARLDIDYQK